MTRRETHASTIPKHCTATCRRNHQCPIRKTLYLRMAAMTAPSGNTATNATNVSAPCTAALTLNGSAICRDTNQSPMVRKKSLIFAAVDVVGEETESPGGDDGLLGCATPAHVEFVPLTQDASAITIVAIFRD